MEEKLSFNVDRMLMANIKIPIVVKENNEIEYLNDYANIFFERCDRLPEKPLQAVNIDFSHFFSPSSKQPADIPMIDEHKNEIILTVSPEEIKPRKRTLNYSFKNKSRKSANMTKRVVSI